MKNFYKKGDPVIQRDISLKTIGKWVDKVFSWNVSHYERENTVYLSDLGCIIDLRKDSSIDFNEVVPKLKVYGGYVPEEIEHKDLQKEIKNYPTVILWYNSHSLVKNLKGCLSHELGHYISGHSKKEDLTPKEILIEEIQAWKRGIDLWTFLSDKSFPKKIVYPSLETYGRFAPDVDYKKEIKNYLDHE